MGATEWGFLFPSQWQRKERKRRRKVSCLAKGEDLIRSLGQKQPTWTSSAALLPHSEFSVSITWTEPGVMWGLLQLWDIYPGFKSLSWQLIHPRIGMIWYKLPFKEVKGKILLLVIPNQMVEDSWDLSLVSCSQTSALQASGHSVLMTVISKEARD